MNRKIILLPLSFAAILALAACNPGTTSSKSGGIIADSSSSSTATSSTSTPTSSSTPVVTQTAAERHAAYLAAVNGSEEKTITVQGVLMGYEHYKGNTAYNAYFQEDIYGYWVNNFVLPDGGKIGDSFSIVGKTYYGDKAKAYPCLKYSSATKLTTALTATRLTLGATGNDFKNSVHAGITTGEVTLTDVDETNGVWKFALAGTTYTVTHNTSVVESDAIVTKMAGVGVGRKVTFKGYWGSTVAATMLATNVSITSADDITVNPTLPDATAVTISGADSVQSVKAGSTVTPATYTAVVTPSGATQTVTWSVKAEDGAADTTAATIAADGVLTPATGITADTKVTVIATSATAGIKGTKQVTVLAVPATLVETITVSGTATVEVGAATQLSAAVAPEGASTAVVWSSSNEGVATVDTNGLVTGVMDGPVTITATATDGSKKTGTLAVTVTNAKVKTWTEIYTAVKDLKNGVASAEFIFKGVIVAWAAGTDNTFLVSDGTNALEVYNAAATKCYDGMAVGDYIEVDSTFQHYYTLIETKAVTSIAKAASDDKPTVPTAVATDAAAFDVLAADGTNYLAGKHLSLSNSRLAANGTKESLIVNGATGTGNASAAKGFTLPDNGKWGTFSAWVVSVNSSTKAVTLWIDGFTDNDPVTATGVTVSSEGDATSVNAGETLQMSAVVAPTLSDQIVTWSVEGTDGKATTLATIDANGLLTGVAAGSVVVRATSAVTSTISGTKTITIVAADATKLYDTGFESAESYTASTTYNNETEATFGPSGKQWGTLEGTATTTGALSGSQSMQMRYYNSVTSVTPAAYMKFDVANAMSISFTYNTTNSYSGELYYSTDSGSTWTDAGAIAAAATATTFKYNFSTAQTKVRFKIAEVAAATKTDKSRFTFDDVLIKTVAQ